MTPEARRHYELWGPWTGNALHAPENPTHRRAPLTARIFAWLCVLAVIGGALAAISH